MFYTRRGYRRQQVFFNAEDDAFYVARPWARKRTHEGALAAALDDPGSRCLLRLTHGYMGLFAQILTRYTPPPPRFRALA
jgi:hypothetical protein